MIFLKLNDLAMTTNHTEKLNFSSLKLNKAHMGLFLFLILFSFAPKLNAQDLAHENQIIDYLGMEKYTSILQSNPAYLNFLDARCSSGYKILELAPEKTVGMQTIHSVKYSEWVISSKGEDEVRSYVDFTITPEEFVDKFNSSGFNFLKYNFQFDAKEISYYVLGNTGKVIMVYPIQYINSLVNSNN